MKILYASRSRNVHDERFVEAWTTQGVELSVLTLSSAEAEDPVAGRATVKDAVSRFDPDVIQAGPILDVGYLIATSWDGPLILTSWGFDLMEEAGRSEEHRMRARSALAGASLLITDNATVTERAVELGMDRAGIVQFPWGIDLDEFSPEGSTLRGDLGWDASHWVVGCTRRHEAYYDVQTVVAGFARFAADRPEARLLLAGGGTLTSDLRQQVNKLGVQDRTVFLGETEHSNLARIYRAFNAYVSASTVDGTSVSLLEAMACRVPTCVSDIPGNRQWVTEETGLRFPVGDPGALAEALGQLFSCTTRSGLNVETLMDNALAMVHREANWGATRTRFPDLVALAVSRHLGQGLPS